MATYNISAEQLKAEGILNSFEIPAVGSFSNLYSTEYDGVDDYVKTDANYTEVDGATKLTVSAWIKIGSSSDSLSWLFSVGGGSARQFGIRTQALTDTTIWFLVNSGGNGHRILTNVGAIKGDGNWHHLLVCADLSLSAGQECQVYLDGVAKTGAGSIGSTSFPSANTPLFIGTEYNDQTRVFGGFVDEVAIWVGEDFRTQSDVDIIYNSGTPNDLNSNGLTAPTSWYRFEEGSGTTAIDTNGSNNGTLINGTTYSTDVPS